MRLFCLFIFLGLCNVSNATNQSILEQKDSLRLLISESKNPERISLTRELATIYLKDSLDIGYRIMNDLIKVDNY